MHVKLDIVRPAGAEIECTYVLPSAIRAIQPIITPLSLIKYDALAWHDAGRMRDAWLFRRLAASQAQWPAVRRYQPVSEPSNHFNADLGPPREDSESRSDLLVSLNKHPYRTALALLIMVLAHEYMLGHELH
jgi:hypothetical protein